MVLLDVGPAMHKHLAFATRAAMAFVHQKARRGRDAGRRLGGVEAPAAPAPTVRAVSRLCMCVAAAR